MRDSLKLLNLDCMSALGMSNSDIMSTIGKYQMQESH
jgi:hypothetical protein